MLRDLSEAAELNLNFIHCIYGRLTTKQMMVMWCNRALWRQIFLSDLGIQCGIHGGGYGRKRGTECI